jgi:DNA-binding MarR family transcriptional regulator
MTSQERMRAAEAVDEVAVFVIRQTVALREASLSAAAALATLDACGPCRLTELAASQSVSQPSMTVMVSRLEKQALVERQRDPSDGRIVLVTITPAGRDYLHRRRAARLAFLSSLIGELDPSAQDALAAAAPILRRLADPAAVPAALDAARQTATDENAAT